MPSQFVPNPARFQEIASSDGVRDLLKERADAGLERLRQTAPMYTGPTWNPAVDRAGEYKAMSFAHSVRARTGWRSEYGSDAPWTLQVEYGTGSRVRSKRLKTTTTYRKPPRSRVSLVKGGRVTRHTARPGRGGVARPTRRTTQRIVYYTRLTRPQGGNSPKTRVMYKSLLFLRR